MITHGHSVNAPQMTVWRKWIKISNLILLNSVIGVAVKTVIVTYHLVSSHPLTKSYLHVIILSDVFLMMSRIFRPSTK